MDVLFLLVGGAQPKPCLISLIKAKSKSWGFTPHPTKEDCSSYPPWMLQDAPNGVESPLDSLPNLLSLPKDASLHLRKLARHPWRDSRNLSNRPAATPRGWCIPLIFELSVGHLKHQIVVDVLFHPQNLTVGVLISFFMMGVSINF